MFKTIWNFWSERPLAFAMMTPFLFAFAIQVWMVVYDLMHR